jgi:hypothetical protein
MTDNLKKKGPADDQRVNVNQPHEVKWWTKKLKCDETKLRQAVRAVGVMVEDVRTWLAANR